MPSAARALFFWFTEGVDEDEEIEEAWLTMLKSGKPMIVDFYDAAGNFYNNKLPKLKIATARLSFPTDAVFQPRLAADITALRKAFVDKACTKS